MHSFSLSQQKQCKALKEYRIELAKRQGFSKNLRYNENMYVQNKQKTLVGILVVTVLGAGSFWFLGRDTSPSNENYTPVLVQKKERVQPATKDDLNRRRRRPVKKEIVPRRERPSDDRPLKEQKKRGKSKKKITKKKMSPAA